MQPITRHLIRIGWVVLWIVGLLWPTTVPADVPTLINYQGNLTDDSGAPLSGKQSINFRLYSSETGGFLFWQEEQLVEVTDGVFNVQLGAVNLLPPSLFNFDTLFLEIQIFNADSVWETLTPRQRFTSTAFAVRAGNADMLAGHTLSDLDADYVNAGEPDAVTAAMIADGSVGASDLGDDSVGAAEIIAGAVATAELADDAVTAAKLAGNSVGSSEVADNSLTAADLASNSVGSDEVIDNSLTAADLAGNSVTASEIAAGAVGSSEILDGTVSAGDLADDYVNTTGDTMTGDLSIGGDINTNGVLKMDGAPVLKIDSSGDSNTFLGYHVGYSNTTGSSNTFLGNHSGRDNTTGDYNTFLGNQAGQLNTEGYANTFVGYQAGYSNTTGLLNTFLGNYAGYSNTTGMHNTFLGNVAGNSNTTGTNNTFLGYLAGDNNTEGHSNLFLGVGSGYRNTTGDYNTFVGNNAGSLNTTGYENTFVGYLSGYLSTGNNNVFIGNRAGYYETRSNQLYIDNSDTSAPLIHGDFSIDSLIINATLAVPGLTGTSSFNVLRYNTTTGRFYYDTSSDRYKEEIQDLEEDFHKILDARPKTYVDQTSGQREIGYIAEAFDEMDLNDLVVYNDEGLPNGIKYDRLALYLVEVVKDQQAEIEELKETIVALANRLDRLEE